MRNPRIEMHLIDEYGNAKVSVMREIGRRDIPVDVPKPDTMFGTFEDVVTQMKQRDFRNVAFKEIGHNLGALMAERLADMEGLHGEERKERFENE